MHIEDLKIPGQTTLAAKLYQPQSEGNYPGILLAHGFASCKEEFMALPHALANAGYAVLTFDFSGHGESTGPRGYVSEHSHLDDILRAYQCLIDRPTVDISRTALLGHSLGTAAVLRFLGTSAGKNPLCAAILAPPYQIRQSVKPGEREIYTLLANLAKPLLKLTGRHVYIPYRVKPKDIYVSPEAIERARTQRLLLPQISVHNHRYMMEVQDNVIYAEKVRTPTLVIAAEKDAIIAPDHSKQVYDALPSPQKKWLEIADSGHSLLGDRQAKKVTTELVTWLNSFLQQGAPAPVFATAELQLPGQG